MNVVFSWRQIPDLAKLTKAQRRPVMKAWSAYYIKRHPIEIAAVFLVAVLAVVYIDDWFDARPQHGVAIKVAVTAAVVLPLGIVAHVLNRTRLASRVHRFLQYKDFR